MNRDQRVIEDFGNEWLEFNFTKVEKEKIFSAYQQYFRIFPWNQISKDSVGFDMGCGSGRWAQFVAPKVKILNCIEPSRAIEVAQQILKDTDNVRFWNETTDTCSIETASQDFGYSLGVLHHIPDTEKALADCARLLKPGAPFLLYLYYNFENKPWWFRAIWKVSDCLRSCISKLPKGAKKMSCDAIAFTVYFPLSRLAWLLEKLGVNVENIPLSDYRDKAFYICRNDALDRFGTRLEQRFSRRQITQMLENTGFERITFSNSTPYWCCISYRV